MCSEVRLTVHSEYVRLYDVLVALCVTRVVAGVDELDPSQVQGSVAEHPHLILVEGRQIGLVASPHDGRGWSPSHVALDLNIVPHTGRQVVHLQRLV
jgi:hypothetical protein